MFEEINCSRRRFLGGAAMTIAAAQFSTIASAKTWFSDKVNCLLSPTQ